MPRTPADTLPSLRLHRSTGQAIVTLSSPNGQRHDYYLGSNGSDESRTKYQMLVAKWLAAGRQLPDPDLKTAGDYPLTIDALAERFKESGGLVDRPGFIVLTEDNFMISVPSIDNSYRCSVMIIERMPAMLALAYEALLSRDAASATPMIKHGWLCYRMEGFMPPRSNAVQGMPGP
ncbi:MAG TPA: hypothetical protein VK348_11330 [Planctomycetota bacterium]|nr:hypothetical protein [Planctomycetota bacterium]